MGRSIDDGCDSQAARAVPHERDHCRRACVRGRHPLPADTDQPAGMPVRPRTRPGHQTCLVPYHDSQEGFPMAWKKRSHGEGGITERPDGTFQAQIRLPNGKRPSRTFDTKRAASRWLAETRARAEHGILPADDKLTMGQYLEQWYASHGATVRITTRVKYRELLDRHILPHLSRLVLARLQPGQIAAFYAERQAAGLGAPTVNLCHTLIRQALQRAVEWGLIPRNPADLVKPPRYKAAPMHPLTPDQAGRLLNAVRGHRFEPFYHVCLLAGLRMGEALGVRWSDLDWQAGAVHVMQQVVYVPRSGLTISEVKTASGRRTVPLPAPTLAVLRAHKDRQTFQRQQAGEAWQDHDLVCTTGVGAPLCPSDVRRDWLALRKQLGVSRTRLHDLRHSYATMLLTAGVHPRVAQERLGHASISITLGTYSHVMPAMHADATTRLTELVFGANWQQNGSDGADSTAAKV